MKDGYVYYYGDQAVITEKSIWDVYGVHAKVTQFNERKIVVIG